MNFFIDGTPVGEEKFSVLAPYDETVDNLLAKASLKMRNPDISKLALFYRGKQLEPNQRMDQLGYTEGNEILIGQRQSSCCSLI
mmetsp:Transcript_8661/g.16934  ORF Transcript_8661/g.16934 Transcript_8661/m.16934 type:complete len:84 (+) Transcript_8661:2056-2307(+)